ncbi:hypothetical protein RJT34_19013 [Clitoria ternatea]|uniref:Uncharacterized protein n=1 Tax=Clitoria ternatea TaxID=43366 RepID=A0AAN9P411_CLITE
MIKACFNQPNTPSSISSSSGSYYSQSQMPQNVVTCIYQTQLCNNNTPTYLTLSWSKTLSSHSLTISAPDMFTTTIPLTSPTLSLFKTRHKPKSKSINHNRKKTKLHWNFTRAEFTQNSAEPHSHFYLGISHNGTLQFFLGDLLQDFTQRHTKLVIFDTNTTQQNNNNCVLLSRREHVFGTRSSYVSRAVFMGSKHDIEIGCGGGALSVKVDGVTRLVVKRLAWKFRGYEKFMVDGVEVEFYWDVLSWVVNSNGNGVFVFQVGDGTVWPEMVGAEKRLMRKKTVSTSSVLQWAEETVESGRTSSSSSTRSSGSNATSFSFLLYAWNIN